MNPQDIQICKHLHEVVYMGLVALKKLILDGFRTHQFTHFQGITGVIKIDFEKHLFLAVISIKIKLFFNLPLVNDWLSYIVSFLKQTLNNV